MHPTVFTILRAGRTAALWTAQPVDRLHQWLTGSSQLPPLWLRRHTGPVAQYQRSAGEMAAYLALRAPIAPSHVVLDIGCGTGVMIPDILRALGPEGRYVGFDVHAPSVRWVQQQWRDDPRVSVAVAEIQTPYSPQYHTPPHAYRFPTPEASVDRLLAKSVFTHLLSPEATHYLTEIRRVLRPEGLAVVSAFLVGLNDGPALADPLLDFAHPLGEARIVYPVRPTAAVAYPVATFERMVADAGLRVVACDPGGWARGGLTASGQDLLVLTPS